MTWAANDLVAALRRQVLALEADLKIRVDGDDHDLRQPGVFEAWTHDYDAAFAAKRTAWTWQKWRNDRVTQTAVGWVLLTVFARYCEDHALVSSRWIGGADADHRAQALDGRRNYFQQHPEHTDREWLGQIIEHFAKLDATKALVDARAPLHLVSPSGDAARALLEFWWQQGSDGAPVYSFAGIDTRFLGDVYQDLSEYAKKTYALLQTPEFIEEFILDQTMEPALADRPLEGFTVIDPACGSGHFLLGAFKRLHERWQNEAPALGARELVQKALDGVHGVDINPFAVAIARFRLLVAAMQAAGDTTIEQTIAYQPHLTAGDSLLWGADQQLLPVSTLVGTTLRTIETEDAKSLRRILQRTHDVVVGNPPYPSPPDPAARSTYRLLYRSIHGKYTLTIPFLELFFNLAHSTGGERPPGWVGQITSNAFMKRDYGQKVVENYLKNIDIHSIIDSEGAWIPGHNSDGTPTVIIVGRNRKPVSPTVLTVQSNGLRETRAVIHSDYWQSIVDNIDSVDYSNKWITVQKMDRSTFYTHPWTIAGDGANELAARIDLHRSSLLGSLVERIGFFGVIGADEAFCIPETLYSNRRYTDTIYASLIQGKDIRDHCASSQARVFFPYTDSHSLENLDSFSKELRPFWGLRTSLGNRTAFSGKTYFEEGRPWFAWHQLPMDETTSPLSIGFAEVESHNHFILNRGGYVFNQTAPIIKLARNASTDDHIRLLGLLNSSLACFWLRHNCKPKGGAADHTWLRTYQFSSNRLKKFPLPEEMPITHAQPLADLTQKLQKCMLSDTLHDSIPSYDILSSKQRESTKLQQLLIARQEELDWDYYRIYGLVEDDLTYSGELPGIALGERAFEIALARSAHGEYGAWFERHGSTPVTEIPDRLPVSYQELLQRRLDVLNTNPYIRVLERPEHKRRWENSSWEQQLEPALRGWLLDQVENEALWFDRAGRPNPQSVGQLADILDRNEDFRSVLQLWAGDTNVATGKALSKLLADESVPFLAAYRYKSGGLEKRAAWENTWSLQRREDAGERLVSTIPVPEKYTSNDFVKATFAARRGEFDVPKERFISYPNAGRDTDTTELLGWAGWDHAEQALALAALISQRIEEGWDAAKLTPLLAGVHELAPWVRQWHNEIDPEYGESVADTIDDELTTRLNEFHLTVTDLTSWRPVPTTRGRRTRNS